MSITFDFPAGPFSPRLGGGARAPTPPAASPAAKASNPAADVLRAFGEKTAEDDESSDDDEAPAARYETWFCQACTLENAHVDACCDACGEARPGAARRAERDAERESAVARAAEAERAAARERTRLRDEASADLDDLFADAAAPRAPTRRNTSKRVYLLELPTDALERALAYLAGAGGAAAAARLRATAPACLALGESDALWGRVEALAGCQWASRRIRALENAAAGQWGCLASGWRWLLRAATTTLLDAAAEGRAPAPTRDEAWLRAAAASLPAADRRRAERAAAATAFEALDATVAGQWARAVQVCLRRDPELLAACVGAVAATTVAERLSRNGGGGVAAAWATFSRWVDAVERGLVDLDDALEARRQRLPLGRSAAERFCPPVRARCAAAFRAAALVAPRPGRRPRAALAAAVAPLVAGVADEFEICADAAAAPADEPDFSDAAFRFAARRLAGAMEPGAAARALAGLPPGLADCLEDVDRADVGDAHRQPLRVALLLPIAAARAAAAAARPPPPPLQQAPPGARWGGCDRVRRG